MSDQPEKPLINQVEDVKNVVAAHTIEKVVIEAEGGPKYVPRMAPPVSQFLTGRESVIQEFIAKLGLERKDLNSLRTIALRGMGGIGKTTLAAAMAHHLDLKQSLPDGTLWVSLGPQPDLMSLLGEWGEQFDEDLSGFSSPAARSRKLSSILDDKAAFLVVDDVWRTDDARLFLVGGHKCRALITTRNAEVARAIAVPNVYQVETLAEEDSLELLKKVAPEAVTSDENGTRQLSSWLGGLPLGLTIAGRLLAEAWDSGIPVQDIFTELQEKKKRLGMSSESQSLDAVFATSYAWLSEEVHKRAFRLLGIFGGKPNTFSLNAAAKVCEIELQVMRKIMVVLVNRALVEVVGPERYVLHALTADFAFSLMNEAEEAQGRLYHTEYYLSVAKQYTSDNMKEWHNLDSDWNNIRLAANWLSTSENLPSSSQESLVLMADFAVALNIIVQVRKPLEGLKWLLAGAGACKALNRLSDQGWLILTIGSIELDNGFFDEAVEHFEQCEEIFASLGEIQGLIYARGNLGLVHHKRGEYSRALEFYEQVTRMCEERDDAYGTAVGCYNLGDIYHLIGDESKALFQLNKSISLCRQENIPDGLVKALALNCRIHLKTGEFAEALAACAESNLVAQQSGSNILLGVATQAMGEVRAAKGEIEIAKQYFQKSLQLLTESKVQEELAEALVIYGTFLVDNGQRQEGRTHWSNAIQIFEQIGAISRAQQINAIIKLLGNI